MGRATRTLSLILSLLFAILVAEPLHAARPLSLTVTPSTVIGNSVEAQTITATLTIQRRPQDTDGDTSCPGCAHGGKPINLTTGAVDLILHPMANF